MRSMKFFSRTAVAVATVGALALSGCAGAGDSTDGGSAGSPEPAGGDLTKVTYALDWEPNTNNLALFVAQELGYFAEEGIEVEVLPYASTPVSQLVSAGEADFGVGGQSGTQMARTSGLDVKQVFATAQTDVGSIVALGDRDDITRPKDLDGKTFGGFGSPLFVAMAAGTIKGDGGKGEFTEVVLDTGAYEALKSGSIDFTLSVRTWENINAEIEGHPYKEWRYQEFGVPDQQAGGVISSEKFLNENPDVAKKFIAAFAKGHQYAADNPEEAAKLLIQANPDTLGEAEELVTKSAKLMASEGILVSPERPVGAFNPEFWEAYGKFLFDGGFLVDEAGEPVTEVPDWSEYYTAEFLPSGS